VLLLFTYIILLILGITLIVLGSCVAIAQLLIDMCFTRVKDPEKAIELCIQTIERNGGNGSLIRQGKDWLLSQNISHHYITSRDGLKLHGIFIKNDLSDKDRVAVMVHGYRGAPVLDFSAAAMLYYNNGFSLFLPDQRTHGQSEGKYITFGSYERYDIVDWCNYINDFTGNKCEFILSGVSMGATTVLLAAAEPDMINLNYITADCGFSSPKRIFADVLKKRYHLPSFPILNIADLICKQSARFGIDEFSTLDSVKKINTPITFIHGGADDFVIPQNTIDAYEACSGTKELIIVPDAEHGVSYIKDTKKVSEALEKVFNTYFS
jgi:fermentation-respiration switch protein FrsA (DUF1100 family)